MAFDFPKSLEIIKEVNKMATVDTLNKRYIPPAVFRIDSQPEHLISIKALDLRVPVDVLYELGDGELVEEDSYIFLFACPCRTQRM